MGRLVRIVIGAAGIALIGLLLWPIFAQGEPILPVALLLFLGAGAILVFIAVKSPLKWSQYALVGIVPGFIIGGIGLWALVRFGSSTSGGWEELIAIAAGLLGAFVGAIVGAVVGGVIGYRKDRRARRTH
jgi:hypothetical protein